MYSLQPSSLSFGPRPHHHHDEGVKDDLIDTELATACTTMKKFEVPTKWAFVAPFTVANDI
jgi:hypothetical protein